MPYTGLKDHLRTQSSHNKTIFTLYSKNTLRSLKRDDQSVVQVFLTLIELKHMEPSRPSHDMRSSQPSWGSRAPRVAPSRRCAKPPSHAGSRGSASGRDVRLPDSSPWAREYWHCAHNETARRHRERTAAPPATRRLVHPATRRQVEEPRIMVARPRGQ